MRISLYHVNREWSGLDVIERIHRARYVHFGNTLLLGSHLTGESAFAIDLTARVDSNVTIVHVREPDVITYMKELRDWFRVNRGHELPIYVRDRRPGETKLAALIAAIRDVGGTALLQGIRSDQTEDRAHARYVELGADGIYRANPAWDWKQAQVIDYLKERGLPYSEVGKRSECGIQKYQRAKRVVRA